MVSQEDFEFIRIQTNGELDVRGNNFTAPTSFQDDHLNKDRNYNLIAGVFRHCEAIIEQKTGIALVSIGIKNLMAFRDLFL